MSIWQWQVTVTEPAGIYIISVGFMKIYCATIKEGRQAKHTKINKWVRRFGESMGLWLCASVDVTSLASVVYICSGQAHGVVVVAWDSTRLFLFLLWIGVDSPNSTVWSFFIRFLCVLFGKTGETAKFAATFCKRMQKICTAFGWKTCT